MEGEFDELYGEGHAGKERQDVVNQIYSNIQTKPSSFKLEDNSASKLKEPSASQLDDFSISQ